MRPTIARPVVRDRPRSLTRRYAPDVAIILATLAFVAVAGLVGLWLMRGH